MDEPLVRDSSDPDEVRRARSLADRLLEGEDADLRAVLGDPTMRRVLWRVLERCGVFEAQWAPDARVHYMQGARSIGIWLVEQFDRVSPDGFARMYRESAERKQKAAEVTRAVRTGRAKGRTE